MILNTKNLIELTVVISMTNDHVEIYFINVFTF